MMESHRYVGAGWRVEFRPCELQFTDFENAAAASFIVLLTRAILSYKWNLLIPLSMGRWSTRLSTQGSLPIAHFSLLQWRRT